LIYKIRQGGGAYIWHLSLIGLAIGLLWAGIGFNLWHDYRAAEEEASADTTNLARAFDENITRTVESVDQTLLFLRDAYQHDPDGFINGSGSWANGRGFLNDLHVRMSLADRNGRILWANPGPVVGDINIANRAHFLAQQNSIGDKLIISRPVMGRVSHQWEIEFVRKLVAPDGSFGGIMVVSLDPSSLSRFYESISIGNGVIMLTTTTGVVLTRVPARPALLGGDVPAETRIRMLQGTAGGSHRAVSSIDGVDRIYSSRRIERYPLVVAVGLSAADIFAPYTRNERLYLAIGAVLSIASVAAGLVMARQRHSLLASRQMLSTTLETMSQGIAMVDAQGYVQVMNQRFIDLLGLPRRFLAESKPTLRQILDWQFAQREFGDGTDLDDAKARVARGFDAPVPNYTYERTRPNGTVLEVRTQGLPDGGIVWTFTDITARKANEVALAAAQARAAHAERMQVLGQLAGGIAHDFNNILQAVQGGASLIVKRAADPDSVGRFARMILDATERGTSITRRLLAFARRGELRAEPVELADLLSGLRDVLSHTLGSPVAVGLHLADDLPPLLADKGQLETVLVNLATNARDAMPEGGTLTFTAKEEVVEPGSVPAADLQPGRYVRITVSDTGTGMDETTLTRAQEPFFSTKPPGQGTGLGLSMAKGFAEQSGGALWIESAQGHGTSVHLWLPATARAMSARSAGPAGSRPQDAAKSVLVVDDEAMVRETLAISLGDAGYTVLVAGDGQEALGIIASGTAIDVLVTDLSMPGMDGLALIRKARKHRPDLPAILLTGYAGHGAQMAVGGSLNGTFTLMRKPVTEAQLIDRIEALLAVAASTG
jgi:signal transduction histidine kinase/ActR/RegA family two-component response regulator